MLSLSQFHEDMLQRNHLSACRYFSRWVSGDRICSRRTYYSYILLIILQDVALMLCIFGVHSLLLYSGAHAAV